MNGDFIEALRAIEKEKEIPFEVLLETIESALVTAYKKHYAITSDINVRVESGKGSFHVFCQKAVVEDVDNQHAEIALPDARKHNASAAIGDFIEVEVTPENFGRIAAQTARQVVVQRLREAEREKIFEEYSDHVGEVMTGTVQRQEQRNVYVNMGKVEALLPANEQVPTEPYRFNDRIKIYVLEVRRTPKGPQVIVSRTHPSLIRRLFELEVPEIHDGIVEIKSVAREPGARSKIAVSSNDDLVDPVGACVGHRGSRVQAVVNELYDEKIDIVRWNDDNAKFIAESLSPAKVVSVETDESSKSAFVVVPDNQLSLAIGKSGQNVRLAARLTGWRIDIRSELQIAKAALTADVEDEPESAEAVADVGEIESVGEAVVLVEEVPEETVAPSDGEAEIVAEVESAPAKKRKAPAKKKKAEEAAPVEEPADAGETAIEESEASLAQVGEAAEDETT